MQVQISFPLVSIIIQSDAVWLIWKNGLVSSKLGFVVVSVVDDTIPLTLLKGWGWLAGGVKMLQNDLQAKVILSNIY